MAVAASAPEFVVYYDPWASGDHGPHIRYPDEITAEGPRISRQRYSLDHGMAVVAPGSLEEMTVRRYLQNRGLNPDALKGNDLGVRKMRCQCGWESGNTEAATLHKAKWPDHDLLIVNPQNPH